MTRRILSRALVGAVAMACAMMTMAQGQGIPPGPLFPPAGHGHHAHDTPDPLLRRKTDHDDPVVILPPGHGTEFVLSGKDGDVAAAEALITGAGGAVLRHHSLGGLGIAMSVVDLGGPGRMKAFQAAMAKDDIHAKLDRNGTYAMADGAPSYATDLVGLATQKPCGRLDGVSVGLVDGPVDTNNPALRGVAITAMSALPEGDKPGLPDHATAIAALIASNGTPDLPAGMAPGARIFSAEVFARENGRDVARVETIALGIDWFLEKRVRLVNMSLAGPFNQVLEQVLAIGHAGGLTVLAAAGNDAEAKVAYPAADPNVIAVTAIDAAKRLYRGANTGEKVDFAAPGVDLRVAGKTGAVYRSGTSYATAIVTGLAARAAAQGYTSPDKVTAALRAGAEDLGAPGHDARFGWGLVQAGGC